jgi:Kdo-III transferase WaaZ
VFPPAGNGKSIIGWSRRPELGFFSGCTVAFAALQIMVRLGARDIEIVGMDLTGKAHAYTEADGAIPSSLDADYEQRILPSFALMGEALKGSGIAIRNLSPVCRLPRRFFPE